MGVSFTLIQPVLHGLSALPTPWALACGRVACLLAPTFGPSCSTHKGLEGCCLSMVACFAHPAVAALELCEVETLFHVGVTLFMT